MRQAYLTLILTLFIFIGIGISAYEPYDYTKSAILVYNNVGMGSGFVVKSTRTYSLIVTNNHVCDPFIYPIKIQLINTSDNTNYNASVVKNKPLPIDLCLLRIEVGNLQSVKISENEPSFGERIQTIGNPNGYLNIKQEGFLSSFIFFPNDGLKQLTNFRIFPGASGSLVVNMNGELVGVINSVVVDKVKTDFGIMIPFRYVKEFLDNI